MEESKDNFCPCAHDDQDISSPSDNTRSKRPNVEVKPLPARKKKLSFVAQQRAETCEVNLNQQLNDFQKCCIRACYTWFSVQILLYCRRQYILLPDYSSRREWLEKEYERLQTNAGCYCYNIDVLGKERKVCCMEAWLFAYGIPKGTQKLHQKQDTKVNKKIKGKTKLRFVAVGAASMFFIVWQFAAKVGDKLPFGDAAVNQTQIRLPYPSKSMVHDIYKGFASQADTTSTEKPISFSLAARIWKHHEELKHIKLAKYKEGFSKCDVCIKYALDSSIPMSKAAREALDLKFYTHC